MHYNIISHYVHNDIVRTDDVNTTYMYLQSASYAYIGIEKCPAGDVLLNKQAKVIDGNYNVTNVR